MAKILYVENDPTHLKAFTRMLETHGFKVVQAKNGKEALELFDDSFAAVIADVYMPGMGGDQLAEELRKLTDKPIFLFTGDYSISSHATYVHDKHVPEALLCDLTETLSGITPGL